jgi:hypothetical protein
LRDSAINQGVGSSFCFFGILPRLLASCSGKNKAGVQLGSLCLKRRNFSQHESNSGFHRQRRLS